MPQYQGVWTLEAQAQAQSNQQWVTDPNFKNTTLLLQADGTGSGSQNQTFLDGSANNFAITRFGNTTQGSFSPFSQAPGYWSNFFNSAANTDAISFPSNAAYSVGTGNFTVEFWLNPTAFSGNDQRFFLMGVSGTTNLAVEGSAAGALVVTFEGSTVISYSWSPTFGSWYHIAACRVGSTVTLYINGTSVATATSSTSISNNVINVGSLTWAGSFNVKGYLSNVRFSATTAFYTSNFTPATTPFTAITGTALLTCQTNRFVDNSTVGATPTTTGTPSVQAFGPFAPALQWTPDVVGGSGYFDGTGDYLILPSSSAFAMGTGQFCLEAWHYPLTNSAGGQILSTRTSGINQDTSFSLMQYTGTTYSMYANNNHVLTNMIPFQWNHVIVTRDASNTLRLILNGVLGNYEASYTSNITETILSIGALNNGGEAGSIQYTSGHRITKGSIPTAYQTASTTIGATIFTPPTQPVTLTSQGATSADVSYLSNYTNAGIYDGKMGNVLETVGNAQVATNPVKYGSGSMYFDGSGDYLVMPQSPTLSVGSGNFTYEMWLFPTDITDTCVFDTRTTNNTTTGFAFLINASSFLSVYTSSSILTCTTPLASSVWQHVAVVRSNGILYVYLNGVSVGSAAFTNNLTDKTFKLGAYVDNTGNFNGFIDDFRLTNGLARYFTTFTPPQQALPRQ